MQLLEKNRLFFEKQITALDIYTRRRIKAIKNHFYSCRYILTDIQECLFLKTPFYVASGISFFLFLYLKKFNINGTMEIRF